MLHQNEYPTVGRLDRLEEGAYHDSIGPHNEFWFISVIENAAFFPLSGLPSPGPRGRWGVSAAAFVFFKFPHSTPHPATPAAPFVLVYPRGILRLFCFVLLRSYWNMDERYGKSGKVIG